MWLLLHKTALILFACRALEKSTHFVQAKQDQPLINLMLFISLHHACNLLYIRIFAHKLYKITRHPYMIQRCIAICKETSMLRNIRYKYISFTGTALYVNTFMAADMYF
jgi:hypothetical protein